MPLMIFVVLLMLSIASGREDRRRLVQDAVRSLSATRRARRSVTGVALLRGGRALAAWTWTPT